MDEFPTTWEDVSTDENYETKRLRVLGGWLVAVRDSTYSSSSVTFIADPQAQWVLQA